MSGIREVYEMVLKGRTKAVELAVQEALAEGCAAEEILNDGMIKAMDEVGVQFRAGEIFVPEMLMSARAMKKGVEVLKPRLLTGTPGSAGKAVIGTVSGDLHDIGKNLVAMMLESAGFEVIDLGVDVSEKKFLKTVEENPDTAVVCISSLLTTSMESMKRTVQVLNRYRDRFQFKVMVGGGPVTEEFAREIGADVYTADACEAASEAKKLVKR